jgi:pimeloyl-ACP methyl ester carboxylesterase
MRRIAVIAVHGISRHEPFTHIADLSDGCLDFIKRSFDRGARAESIFPQVAYGSALAALPLPKVAIYATTADSEEVELHFVEANWSDHTKNRTPFRRQVRWLSAFLSITNHTFRSISRKTWVESFAIAFMAFLAMSGVAASFFAAYVLGTKFNHGADLGFFLACGILFGLGRGVSPWIEILIGGLRKAWSYIKKGWDEPVADSVPDRLLTAFCFFNKVRDADANSSLGKATAFARTLPPLILAALCASLLSMTAHPTLGPFTFTTLEKIVLVLVIFAIASVDGVVRSVHIVLEPFEDIFAFAQSGSMRSERAGQAAAIREVANTILATVREVASNASNQPLYDGVIVAGHSMGSLVSMEAVGLLLRGVAHGAVTPDEFNRIEALVTYGAAIEKTVSFFKLRTLKEAGLSAFALVVAKDIFTPANESREGKRRWVNLWYTSDLVADRVTLFPGACTNLHPLSPVRLWSHGAYSGDPGLWQVITYEAFGAVAASSPYEKADVPKYVTAGDIVSQTRTRPARLVLMLLWFVLLFAALIHVIAVMFTPLLVPSLLVALAALYWPVLVLRDGGDKINFERQLPWPRDVVQQILARSTGFGRLQRLLDLEQT